MVSRIASVILVVVGIAAALLIGLWTLVILGVLGLAAGCIQFLRGRRSRGPARPGHVVEGEFEVVEEDIGPKKHEPSKRHD